MRKATVFKITNNSNKNIVLWPNDEELRKKWAILIQAGHFVIKDFSWGGDYIIDFDDCFFQFEGMKRKIKTKNIKNYGIELEYY